MLKDKNNKEKLLKYIFKKIYSEAWKPGSKIPSISQLGLIIKIPVSTIKETLHLLVTNHFLTTKAKVGFFVNELIYEFLPISIRNKYNLEFLSESFDIDSDESSFMLTKKYGIDNKVKVIVKTEMEKDVFSKVNYKHDQTFMCNLTENDLLVMKIESSFSKLNTNAKSFIKEERTLYDSEDLIIAKETILVDSSIWKHKQSILF